MPMLSKLDLSREVSKSDYREAKAGLEMGLAEMQRRAHRLGIPVVVVFEGWDAAGKGTLINELILPLDPRGISVRTTQSPNEEEALRPFLWRFWCHIPARGRITVFDRSWYRRVTVDRVSGSVRGEGLVQAYADILSFERQLADDGVVIVKFFLHISQEEQERRFKRLEQGKSTAWRVTKGDWKRHRRYAEYVEAYEDLLGRTDTESAPWTVVEAHDRRWATLKVFATLQTALERRIAEREAALAARPESEGVGASSGGDARLPAYLRASVLDQADLSKTMTRKVYERRLEAGQERLRELEYEIYRRRVPVVLAFEGWDAAGKGGNIKRLTAKLDPRGYEVVPVAAPNDVEKAHHYLWRFWMEMPKAGHITVFDRSWYGRVLVERVEGFCREPEWRRAYREINEMEHHLANAGAVVLKFWLHIDREEQLRRFREREKTPYKQWKITPEDWRNREKWEVYQAAVDEMLYRTSTPYAPWCVVESNCKWHARVKVIESVIGAIEARLIRKR